MLHRSDYFPASAMKPPRQSISNPAIPSLTGLRFLAAGFVVISHMLAAMLPPGQAMPTWYFVLYSLSGLGMTLFFVLSGFVIHYTYSRTIREQRWTGVFNFFVARFARLYPLYFVCLLLDLEFSANTRGAVSSVITGRAVPDFVWDALPYYLTMTQSWFYRPMAGHSLVYQFGPIATIAWSISTEWFFYLCYPLACLVIARLTTVRANLVAAVVVTVVGYGLVTLALRNAQEINQFGVSHFGGIADFLISPQDSFFRWLLYFSPYSRLLEFLLGCLVASVHLKLRDAVPSKREQDFGLIALAAGLIGVGVMHIVMFAYGIMTSYHLSFGYAPLVGFVIFCCARYRNTISDALGSRPMVIGGDASYSIYLLHVVAVRATILQFGVTATFGPRDMLWLAGTLALLMAMALVSYYCWERPARQLLRRLALRPAPRPEKEMLAGRL